METNKKIASAIIIIVLVIAGHFLYKQFFSPNYEEFASCLTSKNTVMYGTEWCPHCQNQKKMFGEGFKNIIFIDCDVSPECENVGVEAYPTWSIDGKLLEPGEKKLDVLSKLTECPLP